MRSLLPRAHPASLLELPMVDACGPAPSNVKPEGAGRLCPAVAAWNSRTFLLLSHRRPSIFLLVDHREPGVIWRNEHG